MLNQPVMTQPVVTVALNDRVTPIKEIFANAKFNHLLVIEKGTLNGGLSGRDLLTGIVNGRAKND